MSLAGFEPAIPPPGSAVLGISRVREDTAGAAALNHSVKVRKWWLQELDYEDTERWCGDGGVLIET